MSGGARPPQADRAPASATGDRERGRLNGLDQLRFAAAFAVLLYHYVSSYAPRLDGAPSATLSALAHATRYGYLGVHLFFMISGFVILWSSTGRTAAEFAIGRVVRLYPSFWASLAFTSCLLWAMGTAAEVSVLVWRTVAANATMLPTMLGAPRIDDVYWTLELELRFYALVFVLLATRQMRHIETWIAAWTALMAIELAVGGRLLGLVTLAPYGPFFAAGSQFFLIRRNGLTAPRLAVLAGAGAMCLRQAWAGRHEFVTPDASSAVLAPLIVAMCLGLLWWLSTADAHGRPPSPLAATLGELTYPLYLTHATLGLVALRSYPAGLPAGLRVLLTTLLAIAVALLFVRVELPLRPRLNRRLRRLASELSGRATARVTP